MGAIATYRRVLSNSALARLLVGEFVSSIGDWLYLVALLVLVWAQTNDAFLLGIVGAARIVPYILLSLPAGIIADRYDRRMVLLVTDVARGVIMLLMAAVVILGLSIWIVVALAILATCFSSFFSPSIGAYLPTLVRDESELGPANSLWSSLDNLAFFIGPAFAAVLLGLGSLQLAFILNAITFAIVALVLLRLPPGRPTVVPAPETSGDSTADRSPTAGPGFRDTVRPVARPLVGIGLLNVADGFVFGGLGVVTVVLAMDVFRVGEAGTGLLNSAIGVGGIAGALAAGALVLRRRLGPPLLAGAFGFGIGVVLLGQVSDFALALVAVGVAAAGALLLETVAITLVQRIVPDAVRGRTLGLIETVAVTAYALGSFVVPVLGATEPALVLLACGSVMAIAGVGAVILLGKYAIQEPVVAPAIRELARVPLFAGLPPARLERAMRTATERPMAAGELIIRQGDDPDFFYVIVEGTVDVSQVPEVGGEVRRLRTMGPSEFFGEIGLLSGVARTATVTAATDGLLVALPKEEFLELVSAGPGLTYRLLDLHRGANPATADG